MSAHRAPFDGFTTALVKADPGASGSIVVDRSPCFVPLVSATTETRTLAVPTKAGVQVLIAMKTDGGDITLTVTGGYNEDGDTTFLFDDAGEFIKLEAIDVGGTLTWRMIASHASGILTQTEIGFLEDVTAGTGAASKALVLDSTGYVSMPSGGSIDERNAEVVTTTNVIAATENGRTYFLNAAGGFTSTLPAPALGLSFRFVVKTAPTTAYVITTTSGSNIIYGHFYERAGGAGVAGAAQDTQNFVANQAIIGDEAYYTSDGTNWYVHGSVDVAAGVTFAVT